MTQPLDHEDHPLTWTTSGHDRVEVYSKECGDGRGGTRLIWKWRRIHGDGVQIVAVGPRWRSRKGATVWEALRVNPPVDFPAWERDERWKGFEILTFESTVPRDTWMEGIAAQSQEWQRVRREFEAQVAADGRPLAYAPVVSERVDILRDCVVLRVVAPLAPAEA